MTVQQAFEVLKQLIEDDCGDYKLVAVDTRNGVSSSVSISSTAELHEPSEYDAGVLCDFEGFYCPVYLDH